MSVVSVVCCQAEVSATGWSLVQRSPTECDCEASTMRKPRPTKVVKPLEEEEFTINLAAYLCRSDCTVSNTDLAPV
jgi:hypothetical protein